MLRHISFVAMATMLFAILPAAAEAVQQSQNAGGYRVELELLPLQPIYTRKQVESDHINSGMVIVGAEPTGFAATPKSNHHVIVRVLDEKTGSPVTDAKVDLYVQPFNSEGELTTDLSSIPVVKMETLGPGPSSTHYGNNLLLSSGRYRFSVVVNGMDLTFFMDI